MSVKQRKPFPFMLFLEGKKVVVVGGGHVATRRIKYLLKTGAEITVVSPEITDALKQLAVNKKIVWLKRKFTSKDISQALLVIAATDSQAINQLVSKHVKENQLLNVASDLNLGNFHFPSSYTNGDLTIAVSTNGSSPKLAREIKSDLERKYDTSYIQFLSFLKELRKKILQLPEEYVELKDNLLEEIMKDCYIKNLKKQQSITEYVEKILNEQDIFI